MSPVRQDGLEDDGTDRRYTKNLGRNMIVGIVAVFVATAGLCFLGTEDLGRAAAIGVVPALFAGPYVALLITLVGAVAPRSPAETAPVISLARPPSASALPPAADAA